MIKKKSNTMDKNNFTPDIVYIDDDNQYETRDEFLEIHTKTIDNDFDNVGFLPEIDESENLIDERFGY